MSLESSRKSLRADMEKVSRRKARENAFTAMFEASFGNQVDEITDFRLAENENIIDEYGKWLLAQYTGHADVIDVLIEERLKGWTASRLPKVSLAILRLAIAEMLYSEEDMDSIVINEAVEISKKYGDECDYQFINGVLGNISKSAALNQPRPATGKEQDKQ